MQIHRAAAILQIRMQLVRAFRRKATHGAVKDDHIGLCELFFVGPLPRSGYGHFLHKAEQCGPAFLPQGVVVFIHTVVFLARGQHNLQRLALVRRLGCGTSHRAVNFRPCPRRVGWILFQGRGFEVIPRDPICARGDKKDRNQGR